MSPKERLKKLCLALPEVTCEAVGASHLSFKVKGKKVFAYYTDDHHGDGRIAAWMRAGFGEQELLVKADPSVFFVPPYVGPKGWVGVRLDRKKIDWKGIESLVRGSFRLIAPKKLLASL